MGKEQRMINFDKELDENITKLMEELFVDTTHARTKIVQVLCQKGLTELNKLSPAKKKEVVQEIAKTIYK